MPTKLITSVVQETATLGDGSQSIYDHTFVMTEALIMETNVFDDSSDSEESDSDDIVHIGAGAAAVGIIIILSVFFSLWWRQRQLRKYAARDASKQHELWTFSTNQNTVGSSNPQFSSSSPTQPPVPGNGLQNIPPVSASQPHSPNSQLNNYSNSTNDNVQPYYTTSHSLSAQAPQTPSSPSLPAGRITTITPLNQPSSMPTVTRPPSVLGGMNAAYFTGIDTSDRVSVSSDLPVYNPRRTASISLATENQINEEPPPPYQARNAASG